MTDQYKKLLGYIRPIEPPKYLEGRILNCINTEEKRLRKIRAWAFGSSTLASFGFSLWAVVYLIKSVKETGLWQYFSLIFSENSVALAYWRELTFSLVESLPIVSLILFFTTIGFFIWSVSKIMERNTRIFNISLK